MLKHHSFYFAILSSDLLPFSLDFSLDLGSPLSGTNFFHILINDFAVAMTSSLSLDFLQDEIQETSHSDHSTLLKSLTFSTETTSQYLKEFTVFPILVFVSMVRFILTFDRAFKRSKACD